MQVTWSDKALEQKQFWKRTKPKIDARIQKLINDIVLTPYSGIGKPEPLKYALSGFWSRRIDHEHRLVYSFDDDTKTIKILSCKDHY